MPCVGAGIANILPFNEAHMGLERGPLFAASVKLLQFALRASSASASEKGLTEEEGALLQAIRPLVTNPDCHFLAVLTALVQSILEGRTDCPISGVFEAGKTRAAAAMIAGLLVMDPALKVMVVTTENAAAHAFAKHIESLQLPPSLEDKFGRLVGCSLTQCHFLCGNDRLPCVAGTNQSGIPEWGTWEKFPSAHPTGAGCPERRGFCKSDGGPY